MHSFFHSLWCHLMLHALSRPADYEEMNNGGKQYQCAKCTLKFTRKKDLKAHRESFHRYPNAGDQQQRLPTEALFVSLFACDMCEEMFSGEGDLRRHRLSEHHHHHQHHHQNNAHLFNNHQQFHQQPNHNYSDPYEKRDKPYKCSVCGSRFAEKIYLKWHGNLHRQSRRGGVRGVTAFFRRFFNASSLFDRLRCGTRFDLIANRRWHLTSKREKVLRAQSERYTLDLSVVESAGSRLRTVVHSVGSAIGKWLPKVLTDRSAGKRAASAGHGIDKLYRTTCPNWYV